MRTYNFRLMRGRNESSPSTSGSRFITTKPDRSRWSIKLHSMRRRQATPGLGQAVNAPVRGTPLAVISKPLAARCQPARHAGRLSPLFARRRRDCPCAAKPGRGLRACVTRGEGERESERPNHKDRSKSDRQGPLVAVVDQNSVKGTGLTEIPEHHRVSA
jgi:hypothetical protein